MIDPFLVLGLAALAQADRERKNEIARQAIEICPAGDLPQTSIYSQVTEVIDEITQLPDGTTITRRYYRSWTP